MEKIYGVRDTSGRFYFGLFIGHQLDKAEQLAARNNLVVVELVEKCPYAWPGDDGTAADCVVNGHCGCIHGTTPNDQLQPRAE